MGSFGDKLKRERELRGVTLDEISTATKIGTRALKALEDEHFEQLPGGIFNKGFVRAYAKFLGLNEEQMVSDFVAAQGDGTAGKPDLMAKLAVQAEAQRRNEIAASGGEKTGRSNTIWVTLAVLVLLTAGAAAGIRYYKMKKAAEAASRPKVVAPAPQQVAPPVTNASLDATTVNSATADAANVTDASPAASGTSTPTAANSTTAGSSQVASTTPPGGATQAATPKPADPSARQAIELQIRVSKATWLSVRADDKAEVAETLRDSATKTIVAQDRVVITTGNSVDVTCNGKSLGILGADNQRSQLKISADCKVN